MPQVGGQVVTFLNGHLGMKVASPAVREQIGTRFRQVLDAGLPGVWRREYWASFGGRPLRCPNRSALFGGGRPRGWRVRRLRHTGGSLAPAPGKELCAEHGMVGDRWRCGCFPRVIAPWISVYIWLDAGHDPNLFKAVEVGNSMSGGARAASAVFGLVLTGRAIATRSASARGVFAEPQAYAYGISLIALSVLGIAAVQISQRQVAANA